ncbi:MAG: hypothetical protein JNN15_01210 [Blastocatellia bacterium]|nr:hypothetical protein [Blastocatellia bacterium]
MKRCPICDRRFDSQAIFCPYDGHKLKEALEQGHLQFNLLPDLHLDLDSDKESLEESLTSLAQTVLMALEECKARDQMLLKDQLKLYERFNSYCRTMHYFINNLLAESSSFECELSYKNETDRMILRFLLSIGKEKYKRSFPTTIAYNRLPVREVLFDIDLYEIGSEKDLRYLRTEKVGGKVERELGVISYKLSPPQTINSLELLKWLDNSFKKIFKLAYS